MNDLKQIAQKLVQPGKGILAADESNPSANKRFQPLGIETSQENRRRYRQLLLTASGIEEFLSGVILYDETIRQATDQGVAFPEHLRSKGVAPGIKVDMGLKDLAGFEGEKITQGLDDLDKRLAEYASMGAEFTKWRSVITIGDNRPSPQCIEANAHVLARYAGIVQAAGLVPIVEPEVLLEGDHSLEQSMQVLSQTLKATFDQLSKYRVELEGLILKTSMVLPGKDSSVTATPQQVAEATSQVLRQTVPAEVAGVVFLSGGQPAESAIINLNEIAKLGPYDWGVTFSYSRALQDPVLRHWAGDEAQTTEAQDIFLKQVKKAALAQAGQYHGGDYNEQDYVSASQDL